MPGWIRRDFLPELQGRKLWLVYEQMGSNDAYVGSALNAYSLFIRRTTWHIDPVVDENEENGSAEFLETCMNDMQHSWQTFIATAPLTGAPLTAIDPVRRCVGASAPRHAPCADLGA